MAVVVRKRPTLEDQPGPRHTPEYYDQRDELLVLRPGDRMFVACEGGPCWSRRELFPPRLEVADSGGTYVLLDEGPRDTWLYLWVPTEL
jgi:hypothetical protein